MKQSIKILESHNAHRRGDADGYYCPEVITQAIDDCIKAAKRYEFVRTMNPRAFRQLTIRNIYDGENFDDMVDKLIKDKK